MTTHIWSQASVLLHSPVGAAGAAGYMIKRAVADELSGAIHAVAGGESYVHPTVMS